MENKLNQDQINQKKSKRIDIDLLGEDDEQSVNEDSNLHESLPKQEDIKRNSNEIDDNNEDEIDKEKYDTNYIQLIIN